MKLSVVVPCYNEADGLVELRRRVVAACEAVVGDDFEIVLIDDGSRDQTRSMITRFHDEDRRFVGCLLARNHGHQLALTAGLSVARGERVMVLDADLQDPPELLGPMMELMDQGFDVVYGQRRERTGETYFKKKSASLFYRLLNLMVDTAIPEDTGDFRLMSSRVVEVLQGMPERQRYIRGMVAWIGFRQTAIEYDRDPRFAGETKYPLAKMLRLALDAITAFSTVPLRLATWMGFALAFISCLLILYTLAVWVAGRTVDGWTSLMMIVLLIGGMQMIMIGVLGEYLGRLYMESKRRPIFIIETVLRAETKVPEVARRAAD
ncbi:MAG: glycosyltransferase [Pseudomonadota bacterium]